MSFLSKIKGFGKKAGGFLAKIQQVQNNVDSGNTPGLDNTLDKLKEKIGSKLKPEVGVAIDKKTIGMIIVGLLLVVVAIFALFKKKK